MRIETLLLLIIVVASLASCERRYERITALEASNLRRTVVSQTNEHVVLLDVKVPEDDWGKIDQLDPVLYSENCSDYQHNHAPQKLIGIQEGSVHRTKVGIIPATNITFNMISTNFPPEIDESMSDIVCVRLKFNSPYLGTTSFFSDQIRVSAM